MCNCGHGFAMHYLGSRYRLDGGVGCCAEPGCMCVSYFPERSILLGLASRGDAKLEKAAIALAEALFVWG